jgi:hypothetical protein
LQIYRESPCRKIRRVPANLGIGLGKGLGRAKGLLLRMVVALEVHKKYAMVGNQHEEQNDF